MQSPSVPSRRAAIAAPGASRRNPTRRGSRPCIGNDRVFINALVENRDHAWHRFMARFDGLIRESIRRATRRGPVELTAEDLSDIRASFLSSLCENEKKKLRAFDAQRGMSLSTWIAFLAGRRACEYVRSLRSTSRERFGGGRGEGISEARSPEALVDEKQHVALVLAAVTKMPPRERELFDLYFERGLPPTVVAERMGTSLQTVYASRFKLELHLARAVRHEPAEPFAA